MIKIGNAQGFWGDQPSAAARLVEQAPDLNVLTLDYLAEVSLSIMAIQREKDPSIGYAQDFLGVISSLLPFWEAGHPFKVVTNAGGLNPLACGAACQEILAGAGKKIAVIDGDDVLADMEDENLVTANAYLGAEPLTEALDQGADLVITGRVADPSLVVAACRSQFGWKKNDYDRLAGATVAGHLIECGTQVTGGIWTHWLDLESPFNIGYPIVEVSEDGSCIVTKPPETGGIVNLETVKEQLLYEIGDPGAYLSPDTTVSFLEIEVKEVGKNRVFVRGAKGRKPPSKYKVSATFRDGFKAEGMLAIYGRDVVKKAKLAGQVILKRLESEGVSFERTQIECIGAGEVAFVGKEAHPPEAMLRIAVADPNYESVKRFTKEIASLVTCGPQGITGYTSGRPPVRPIFGFKSASISVSQVEPRVQILEGHD